MSKTNVLAFVPRVVAPVEPTIVEREYNVLVCSLCESNAFYMLLNDEKQVACSEYGHLTSVNWDSTTIIP